MKVSGVLESVGGHIVLQQEHQLEPPVTDVQSSVWSAVRLTEIHLRSEQSNRFVCDIDS